ncbi:MAG TPA: DUF6247 family protein [Pseudonocardiaceae bacterium]|nr:DUF6247 family protein [Pseudonocardiaceae bacterium]
MSGHAGTHRSCCGTCLFIERSGPVIRAALAKFAPDECAQFEAEFQQAIAQASETFNLAPLDAMLDR